MAKKTGELHPLVVKNRSPRYLAERKKEMTARVMELGRLRELA
jgi:hypothetical protein